MKKVVLLGLAIDVMAYGMIVPSNKGELEKRVEGTASNVEIVPSSVAEGTSADQMLNEIDLRKITTPVVEGNEVRVRVCEFVGGEQQNAYYKVFPLQKNVIDYQHDFANNVSYPIEELSTIIEGIDHADINGKMMIGTNTDRTVRIPHKRKMTGRCEMDDTNLRAKPFTEIYIEAKGGEKVISPAQVRSDTSYVNYTSTTTAPTFSISGNVGFNDKNCSVEVKKEYRRPDNSLFVQRKVVSSPVYKSNLGYENDFSRGISYAKERLYTSVEGKTVDIRSGTNYSDRYNHIKRTTSYEHDDANLRSNPYTEIYIRVSDRDNIISSTRHRGEDEYVYYTELETGRPIRTGNNWSDDDYTYYETKQETKYRRPDGTIFRKETVGKDRVAKPRPTAPVSAPSQRTTTQQQSGSGGHRDIARNIVTLGRPGSDCSIM